MVKTGARDFRNVVPQAELPKGLDRKTLKFVWEKVSAPGTAVFTTEDMARNAGISRVSMRKYLDFLEKLGVLSVEMNYGAVGRPVYKFRCISPEGEAVKRFLP